MSKDKTRQEAAKVALIEQIKKRIAYHAQDHRHHYVVGKGVDMDYLARGLLDDFKAAGGLLLPVKPNDTVYMIRRRRVVSATVMFVGAGADGMSHFTVLRGRIGTTAWSTEQFQDTDIGRIVFTDPGDAAEALTKLKEGGGGDL